MEVCKLFFDFNVNLAFNHFVHHFILNFFSIWRYGSKYTHIQFDETLQKFNKKQEKHNKQTIIYLHQKLFFYKENYTKENFCSIYDFNQAIEEAFEFTIEKFSEIIKVSKYQSKYYQVLESINLTNKGTKKKLIRKTSKISSRITKKFELIDI